MSTNISKLVNEFTETMLDVSLTGVLGTIGKQITLASQDKVAKFHNTLDQDIKAKVTDLIRQALDNADISEDDIEDFVEAPTEPETYTTICQCFQCQQLRS